MDPDDAKKKGNDAFKKGKYELSIKFYQVFTETEGSPPLPSPK